MEVKATAKYIRIAPRKLRIVMNLIRGKNVNEAFAILQFTPKVGSEVIEKVLRSAVANAEHNKNLPTDTLFVKEIWCGKALTMKRIMPGPRGSARPILKPFSNLTIVLESGVPAKKSAAKKEKTEKKKTK